MGKQRKRGVVSQRLGKGTGPASSAGASSALGEAGGGGFIGFSAFSSSSDTSETVVAEIHSELSNAASRAGPKKRQTTADRLTISPFYSGGVPSLRALFKSTTKKDSITKLKALQDMLTLLPACTRREMALALPHYAYLFIRTSKSNDRHVRLAANSVLRLFAERGFPCVFDRILDDIVLPLWCACFEVK